jgi:hypothetical protein
VTYPKVADEFETIKKVLKGFSLSRYGDGELKILSGKGYVREAGSAKLTAELVEAFQTPAPMCLVGIPTMCPDGPKYESWLRHEARFLRFLKPKARYYSAFVTRPDSAPWIDSPEYVRQVQHIWLGKRAVVLCEERGSMRLAVAKGAESVKHVVCPRHEAYAQIDRLEREIVKASPDVAILSAGPTASCLANRLAARGIQAVDLGSAGQFLAKRL